MGNNRSSQYKAVKKHFDEGKGLTSYGAVVLFGATRLSAIIYRLRHEENYQFEITKECAVSRYGQKTIYYKYKRII